MATDAIERIYKLQVDGTQAVRSLQAIEKNTGDLSAKIDNMGKALKGSLAFFAIQEAASRFLGFLIDTGSAMTEVADAATKLGTSASFLETFRLAAEQSGSSAADADAGLKALSKTMAEFDAGNKNVVNAFNQIGVNPSGKSTAEVINEVADAMAKLPDDANKTALAMQLFGKAGAELIPTLTGGSEAIAKAAEDLEKFGLALTPDDVKNAKALGDAMGDLQKQSEGAARQFNAGIIPSLTEIAKMFTSSKTNADFFREAGEKVGIALQWMALTAKTAAQALAELGKLGAAAFKALSTWDASVLKDASVQFQKNVAEIDKSADAQISKIRDMQLKFEADRTARALGMTPGGVEESTNKTRAALTKTAETTKKTKEAMDDFTKTMKSLDTEYDSVLGKLEDWNRLETLNHQVARDNLKLSDDQLKKLQERAKAIDELNAKLKEQQEIEEGFQKAVQKGDARTQQLQDSAQAWKELLDPMIKYQAKYNEIKTLEQAGFLQPDEAAAAREKTIKDAEKAMDEFNKKGKESTDVWKELGKALDDALGQGLADILLEGERSFTAFVDSFLKQMARILLNSAIKDFFAMLMGGDSKSSSGGFFENLFSGFGKSSSAAAMVPAPDMLSVASPRLLGASPAYAMPTQSYQVGILTADPSTAMANVNNAKGQASDSGTTYNTYISVKTDTAESTTTSDDLVLARKIDNAVKAVIINEQRPGGILDKSK